MPAGKSAIGHMRGDRGMRIAICDDEKTAREYLASLVRTQARDAEIVEYGSAAACLADPRTPDLLFLDIRLTPGGEGPDGMALARALREREDGTKPVIVFVTGYDRYVFDAFDVGAFQYLLKPVDEAKFARVFARAAASLREDRTAPPRALVLQSAGTSRTVALKDIYYLESSDHQVIVHLRDSQLVYYARLRDLELALRGRFFRIHKGYLVNFSHVSGYSKTEVTLSNGARLLISKYKYQAFAQAHLQFLKAGAGL